MLLRRSLVRRAFVLALALPAPAFPALDTPFWGRLDSVGGELFGVDTAHSYLGFTVGFMGLTRVRGSFKSYSAAIVFDETEPRRSSVTVVVDPASITTGSDFRDKDLIGASFFDVEHHPRIVFQSTRVEAKGPNRYLVTGTLEIRGVRREIAWPMEQTVPRGRDSGWGNLRIGGSGRAAVKRSDFHIAGNEFWGKAIAEDVEIEIELLALRSNFDRWGFDGSGKPSIGKALWTTIEEKNVEAAVAQYRGASAADYNLAPGQLSIVANRLLQRRRFTDALEILKLAAAAAPSEAAFQARMGETYAALGDRAAAVAAYRRAFELDSGNAEAMEMLRRLGAAVGSAASR